jgi:hypothetical protein
VLSTRTITTEWTNVIFTHPVYWNRSRVRHSLLFTDQIPLQTVGRQTRCLPSTKAPALPISVSFLFTFHTFARTVQSISLVFPSTADLLWGSHHHHSVAISKDSSLHNSGINSRVTYLGAEMTIKTQACQDCMINNRDIISQSMTSTAARSSQNGLRRDQVAY